MTTKLIDAGAPDGRCRDNCAQSLDSAGYLWPVRLKGLFATQDRSSGARYVAAERATQGIVRRPSSMRRLASAAQTSTAPATVNAAP